MRVHVYIPDTAAGANHRDEFPCRECPLPEGNKCHKVPERTDDERAMEARWIGETE